MAALPPIGLAVSAAGSVVRSLLDIASLFRRDVAIQGRELSIPDMALVLEIANKLANKSADKRAKVFVPELFPLDVASTVSWKQIASKLDDARESAAAARHRVDAMPEGDARVSQQKRLDDTAAAFAGLEKSVLAPDDQAKRDELPLLFRGAAIAQVLGDGGRVLYAKVLRAGGNVTTETSRLHGSEVTYGGGVIASFAILDRDGSIIAADTVMEYRERD